MTETCFILGAGFSAPAKIPLQTKLLESIENNTNYKDTVNSLKGLFHVDSSISIQNITLEDIFTFLDRAISNEESISGFSVPEFYKLKHELISYIIELFNNHLKTTANIQEYTCFFKNLLTKRLKTKSSPFSIISLNWDTIPEFYIEREFKKQKRIDKNFKGGIDYTCYDWNWDNTEYKASILKKEAGYKTIKIYKLHGSINWAISKENDGLYVHEQKGKSPNGIFLNTDELRNGFENIIITPTLLKNLNSTYLKMIWQNASYDLRETKRIVFLGYSFPMADFEFRYLLLKTAMKKEDLQIRVLLYPGDPHKDEVKERYNNFFVGRDIKFEDKDVACFMKNDKLIWKW